jgi:hypothetical protein
MSEISVSVSRTLPSAAVIAIVGILVAAPRASSQATPTPTDTATPAESPTFTPTASGTATPAASPSETATPAQAPTTAPAETPVVVPTVPPTPFVGGSAGATSASDEFGTEGETVGAGAFEIRNTTADTERVTRVVIDETDPEVVSLLSLSGKTSGASQTAIVTSPTGSNVFVFEPGMEIPAGEAASFSLSATIAATSQTTAEPTATSGPAEATPTPEPTPTQTPDPFALSRVGTVRVVAAASIPLRQGAESRSSSGGLAAVVMLLAMAASRTDRRGLSASLFLLALAALLWMNALPGCGAEQTTTQTVGRISAETDSGPVTFSGVPFSLGTVSRPQNLVFPGAAGSTTASPTP